MIFILFFVNGGIYNLRVLYVRISFISFGVISLLVEGFDFNVIFRYCLISFLKNIWFFG